MGGAAKARMTQRRLFLQSSRPCPKDSQRPRHDFNLHTPHQTVERFRENVPTNSNAPGWRRAQPQDWKVSAIVDRRDGLGGRMRVLPELCCYASWRRFYKRGRALLTIQLGTLVTGELLVSLIRDFLGARGWTSDGQGRADDDQRHDRTINCDDNLAQRL